MKPITKIILIAVASSLVTFVAVSPMITFPGSSKPGMLSTSCGSEMNQMTELERYGSVSIKYEEYVPYYQKDQGRWTASFSTPYGTGVQVSSSTRNQTLCEAIDTLYYTVMEHPLKPKD
jgi:hypothetical protein